MPILIPLDQSDETTSTLGILKKKFNIKKEPLSKFDFKETELGDFQEVVCLGHSTDNGRGIGDFKDADTFVNQFNTSFEKKYKKDTKVNVKHVYLIGCEAGLEKDNKSLAQEIANKFSNKGFTNIQVHAIANPLVEGYVGMRVRIVKKAGIGKVVGKEDGETRAYLLTEQQEKEINELEDKIANSKERKIKNSLRDKIEEIENNGLTFLLTDNFKAELDRPHNTFIPNKAENRPKKLLAQEEALMTIENYRRLITFQGKVEKANKLMNLITNVGQATDDQEWRKVVESYVKKIRFPLFSGTKEMLSDILKTKRDQPQHGLFEQNKKVSVSKKKVPMPEQMKKTIDNLNLFSEQLGKEYKYKRRLFGGLCPTTKDYKAKKLRELADSISNIYQNDKTNDVAVINESWMKLVKDALTDKKLIESTLSTRTVDL